MRQLSRTGMLLLLAFSIPVIVEFRTLLALVGIDVSGTATLVFGAAVVGALLLWRLASLDAKANGG
ncbi:CbaC protein [Halobacteriales archaeon Cl-PHB]